MTSAHPTVAILASGEGTTAEAFIRASATGAIDTRVGLIICNRAEAGVFKRVNNLNKEYGLSIDCLLISSQTHPAAADEDLLPGQQTAAERQAILDALNEGGFDAVCLMGYMRRVHPELVREFGWRPDYTSPYQARMVNTHPGLLPETKGLYGIHVQEHVLANKLPFGGQSLHVVSEAYDEGPVLAEHRVAVEPGDTPDSLFDRVKAVEKKYLPTDIDNFIKRRRHELGQA